MKIAGVSPSCFVCCWHVENLFSPPASSSSTARPGSVTGDQDGVLCGGRHTLVSETVRVCLCL